MQKVIEVEEGRSIHFKASAYSPIMYNRLFPGKDFIRDMESLKNSHDDKEESNTFKMSDYEHFVRIAFLFAYQGLAPSIHQTDEQKAFLKQYQNPWEWVDTFDTFSIYEILPQIMDLWYKNDKKISQSKNGIHAPPGK